MNFVLHGSSVSSGITIGYAQLVSSARLEVAHYEVAEDAVEAEVARFDAAFTGAKDELTALGGHIPADAPPEFAAFLNLHRMILGDSSLSHAPRALIREQRCNAEWALVQQMEKLVAQFEEIEDPYLRERRLDIQQVVERVLKALMGGGSLTEPQLEDERKRIVVARTTSRPRTWCCSSGIISAASSPTWAGSPRTPRSWRAASASRRWSACTTRAR